MYLVNGSSRADIGKAQGDEPLSLPSQPPEFDPSIFIERLTGRIESLQNNSTSNAFASTHAVEVTQKDPRTFKVSIQYACDTFTRCTNLERAKEHAIRRWTKNLSEAVGQSLKFIGHIPRYPTEPIDSEDEGLAQIIDNSLVEISQVEPNFTYYGFIVVELCVDQQIVGTVVVADINHQNLKTSQANECRKRFKQENGAMTLFLLNHDTDYTILIMLEDLLAKGNLFPSSDLFRRRPVEYAPHIASNTPRVAYDMSGLDIIGIDARGETSIIEDGFWGCQLDDGSYLISCIVPNGAFNNSLLSSAPTFNFNILVRVLEDGSWEALGICDAVCQIQRTFDFCDPEVTEPLEHIDDPLEAMDSHQRSMTVLARAIRATHRAKNNNKSIFDTPDSKQKSYALVNDLNCLRNQAVLRIFAQNNLPIIHKDMSKFAVEYYPKVQNVIPEIELEDLEDPLRLGALFFALREIGEQELINTMAKGLARLTGYQYEKVKPGTEEKLHTGIKPHGSLIGKENQRILQNLLGYGPGIDIDRTLRVCQESRARQANACDRLLYALQDHDIVRLANLAEGTLLEARITAIESGILKAEIPEHNIRDAQIAMRLFKTETLPGIGETIICTYSGFSAISARCTLRPV